MSCHVIITHVTLSRLPPPPLLLLQHLLIELWDMQGSAGPHSHSHAHAHAHAGSSSSISSKEAHKPHTTSSSSSSSSSGSGGSGSGGSGIPHIELLASCTLPLAHVLRSSAAGA